MSPMPNFAHYSGTKVFDHNFSHALRYELAFKGIDVLSVMPGLVATPLTKRTKSDIKELSITSESCAQGILNNVVAGYTFGGALHEITGFFSMILIESMPQKWTLTVTGSYAKNMQEKYKEITSKAK